MPGYLTQEHTVAVAGVANLCIRSLQDRQQYADPLGEAARLGISSASWPLFGMLWPSGAQLAAQLALRPVRSGERILEIGCGLALASLVAHRRGAHVTASDCHPLAAAFLAENLRLNNLAPLDYRHGQWGAEPGSWTPRGRLGAPAATALAGQYDLIVGSDLLYEPDPRATLATFIACHAAPGAEIWVLDPQRGNRPAFHRQMAAQGFGLTQTDMGRASQGLAAAYRGRLLRYRRG